LRVRFERDLAEETLVVQEKFGGQDALPIALLKQISGRLRGAPKGVFRMRPLPSLKLLVSFLRLQFVERMKASVEFRHVQRSRVYRHRSNTKGYCHQRAE
jgi:hypothetical protein